LPAGATGELLIGSPRPLAGLALQLAPPGAARLQLRGATLVGSRFLPSGGARFELDLRRPSARHRMWWSADDYWLYRVRFAVADETPREAVLELHPRYGGEDR
jgi:hypothetical protein